MHHPKLKVNTSINLSHPKLTCLTCTSTRFALTGGSDHQIRLYNLAEGTPITSFTNAHTKPISALCISHDREKFISGARDSLIYLWSFQKNRILNRITFHKQEVTCIAQWHHTTTSTPHEPSSVQAQMHNPHIYLSASHDCTAAIWDMRSASSIKRPLMVLTDATDAVLQVTCLSEYVFLTGSMDGCMRTYDVRRGIMHVDHLPAPLGSFVHQRIDADAVMCCTLDSTIRKMSLSQGTMLAEYHGHKNVAHALPCDYLPSEQFFCSASEDYSLCIWNTQSSELIFRTSDDEAFFSPQGEPLLDSMCVGLQCLQETRGGAAQLVCGLYSGRIELFNIAN